VVKVAAGAVEHLAFCVVGGIPAALAELQRAEVFTIGLAADADRSIYDLSLGDVGVALVVGGEERGLAPLARRRCDEVVAIPQHGGVASLNVAAAGTVACFEVARWRAEQALTGA
jgi:23S rRNA (guanosine2251-2'-O)-methyltransferase